MAGEQGDVSEAPFPGSALDGASTWVTFVWSCALDISVSSAVAFHNTCFYHQKHAIDSQESKEIVARTLSVFFPNPQTGTLYLPSFSSVQTYEGTPRGNCSERLPQQRAFRSKDQGWRWKTEVKGSMGEGQRWYCPPRVLRPDLCATAHECCAVEVWRPPRNPMPSNLSQLLLRTSIWS